jgi:aquaporin Z
MLRMSWVPKAFTELVGTFFFLTVIALSGKAGAFTPLAIGFALTAMVYMGGHVSGAHYNPAVSFGAFLRGKMPLTEMLMYWAAQLSGAVLAFTFGYLVTGQSGGIHPGAGVQVLQAVGVEVVFTAALVVVVLNVAFSKTTHGNSFYGIAIGLTIAAAAFVGGPISGGAYNPGVGIGATVSSAWFGGGGWSDLWIYLAGPLAGAAIGAGINYVQGLPEVAADDIAD